MSMHFDVYWSFRSPYSYLATRRLVAMAEDSDVVPGVRIVLPIAVRDPSFFKQVNPLWPPYLLRDTARIAEQLGLPFSWPSPDPIVQDYATGQVAKEQPLIWRLSRLGVAAAERGRALAFIDEVSRLIWSGQVKGWHEGPHLAGAASRAGLDPADLDRAVESEPERLDSILEQNAKDLEAAGHWGVPTLVFQGEPFFGQDRIDLLRWRMQQQGLKSRQRA